MRDRKDVLNQFLQSNVAVVDPTATFYPTSLTLNDDNTVTVNDDTCVYNVSLDTAVDMMMFSSTLSFK